MFDWSGKNGDTSGKSQGILISCVSGNPAYNLHPIREIVQQNNLPIARKSALALA